MDEHGSGIDGEDTNTGLHLAFIYSEHCSRRHITLIYLIKELFSSLHLVT